MAALAAIYAPPADADVTWTPESADFGTLPLNTMSAPQTLTLSVTCHPEMAGCAPDPLQVAIEIEEPGDPPNANFHLVSETCPAFLNGMSMTPDSCTVTVTFKPLFFGLRGGVVHSGEELNPPAPEPEPGPTAQLNGYGFKPSTSATSTPSSTSGGSISSGGGTKKCKNKKGKAKKRCKKRKKP